MAANGQQGAALREELGSFGVWLGALGLEPAARERDLACRLEALGYGALWFGEALANREALSHAAILLGATERIAVASGIANIWVRDATAAANGAYALNEAFDGRFVLGLGVSHRPIVDPRGHDYGRPLAAMRAYLDGLDAHRYGGPAPAREPRRVLAALRPRMLELARDRAAGAHPYFVPPEYTERARALLGAEPFLAPEQVVVLDSDPSSARSLGRRHMQIYLQLPNYLDNLRQLGFDEEDFVGGGSDRLVDAIVAWGTVETVVARVREHLQAGADHVAVQAHADTPAAALAALEELAPALGLKAR
ncbi:MAG TPA: TIGR03620 family F420-dependent LLM class oxidoreductase [Solirubrobacteraceae bacterium]|nr:TIGR03620 family F420-dependent LLM class oxidoreductase [Solirubrobacteraceae bacterium]